MTSDYDTLVSIVNPLAEQLRSALRTCLRDVLPPDVGARSTGRGLGVSRTLGWRVFAVAQSADTFALLQKLPGKTGWSRIYLGLERGGCPSENLDELRRAVDALQGRISDENVDPAWLRALGTGSMESQTQQRAMLRARRSAFNAAKRIYGVHAKARFGAVLVTPSPGAGDGMIDLVSLSLFEGLERSRPGSAYPIYQRVRTYAGQPIRNVAGRNLGGNECGEHTFGPLVASLCSDGAIGRELRISTASGIDGRSSVDFVDRDHRRTDSLRAAFAEYSPRVGSAYASALDTAAECRLPTMLPVEFAIFDVFIHQSLPTGSEPALGLYSHPSNVDPAMRWTEQQRLPLEADSFKSSRPGVPASLASARQTYKSLLKLGEGHCGCPLEEFRLHRAIVPHPPMHSSLVVVWRLAER